MDYQGGRHTAGHTSPPNILLIEGENAYAASSNGREWRASFWSVLPSPDSDGIRGRRQRPVVCDSLRCPRVVAGHTVIPPRTSRSKPDDYEMQDVPVRPGAGASAHQQQDLLCGPELIHKANAASVVDACRDPSEAKPPERQGKTVLRYCSGAPSRVRDQGAAKHLEDRSPRHQGRSDRRSNGAAEVSLPTFSHAVSPLGEG